MAHLERYCQNKDFEIIQQFSFDESAYKSNREEFDQIVEFVLAQNKVVAVCCDKVDRLTRNMFDKRVSLLYEKALQDELELHFVSDGQVITSKISAAEKFQFSISLGLAKEQQNITQMMDNLYMDKLKGSITESEYDRFFQKFCNQRDEIAERLTRLQEAETNYYITAKYILDLANRAHELFESSEVDEKRQLIKLLLSNLQIKGENIVYDVQKPFDLIMEPADSVRFYQNLFLALLRILLRRTGKSYSQNRFAAKALPAPDFRYFSNFRASC